MALKPRILIVFVVVYLIFHQENYTSEIFADQPPKHDSLTSRLPVKESPKKHTERLALIQFGERVINKLDESHYIQHMMLLVQRIGSKYTGIVLRISNSKVEVFKKTLTNIFLKVVSTENEIRRDQNLNLIKVYIPIAVKSVLDMESTQESQFLGVDLIKYLIQEGNISGLILEASVVLTPISLCMESNSNFHDSVHLTVKQFQNLMITLEHRFGYKLELGLAVNALQECGSSLVNNFSNIILLFDLVVYIHGQTDTNEVNECIKLFRNNFFEMKFHEVKKVFKI